MAEEIEEEQTRTVCSLGSILCWITGATYYRQVIVAYRDREGELRDRVIEEWTTVSLVAALIITLAFSLFLQSPATFDTLAFVNTTADQVDYIVIAGRQYNSKTLVDMYGICSSLSVGCLLGAVLLATMLIANSSLLLNNIFPLFLTDHIHILMWPTILLGTGLIAMSLALIAWGFIAYSQTVAIFNIVLLLFGSGLFSCLYVYSVASRVIRLMRHR